jgi:hypothetical protein
MILDRLPPEGRFPIAQPHVYREQIKFTKSLINQNNQISVSWRLHRQFPNQLRSMTGSRVVTDLVIAYRPFLCKACTFFNGRPLEMLIFKEMRHIAV